MFIEGNSFGGCNRFCSQHEDDDDDNTMWEVFYSFAVSDNITVTPAIFGIDEDGKDDVFGGIMKTTFKF